MIPPRKLCSRSIVSRLGPPIGLNNGLDLWVALCVGLAAFKLLQGFDRIFDLPLGDESYYLFNGVKLAEQGFPSGEWSPLYALWYWILAGFEWTKDNLNLYFFNQKVLVSLTASMLYLAMRSLAIQRRIGIIATWIYLLSSIPVILPRPSHLVLLLILISIALQNRLRTELDFYLTFGSLLLICAFIRPEFFIAFLMVSVYVILLFGRHVWLGHDRRLQVLKLSAYIFLASLLIGKFGIPTAAGDRGWQAFCQHFSLRWSWSNPTELNPWLDSSKIIEIVFGEVGSLREAMFANPSAFWSHIFGNIKGIFQNGIDILDGSLLDQSPSLRDINPQWDSVLRVLELGILTLAIGFVVWKIWQKSTPIVTPTLQRLLMMGLFLGVPVLPAIVIIFPRYHYLIIHLVLGMIGLSYLLSQVSDPAGDFVRDLASDPIRDPVGDPVSDLESDPVSDPASQSVRDSARNRMDRTRAVNQVVCSSLVLLALTPTLATGWCLFGNLCLMPRRSQPVLPNVETIRLMRQLQPEFEQTYDRPPNILAAELEYRPFVELGHSFDLRHFPDAALNIVDFVESNQVDWIVVSPALQQDRRLNGNEAWQHFLTDPGSEVQQVEISGTDRSLLRLR